MANNGKGLEKFGLLVSFFCIFTAAQLNMNDSVPFVLFYTRPNVCVCVRQGANHFEVIQFPMVILPNMVVVPIIHKIILCVL